MKKITLLVILVITIILSGCVKQNGVFDTKQDESSLENVNSTQKQSEELPLAPLPTFKKMAGEKISHPECSESNPPRIESGKGGKFVNLCDEDVEGYDAVVHEFEKENLILFIRASEYEEQKLYKYRRDSTYSLRTILTKPPFEEEILVDDIQDLFGWQAYFEDLNLFFWHGEAEGWTSRGYNYFIFEPASRDFILFSEFSPMNDPAIYTNIIGSKSPQKFYKEFRMGPSFDDYRLSDDDVALIINEKTYTKKDVDEGHLPSSASGCNPLYFYDADRDRSILIAKKYLEYFPDKWPCFDHGSNNVYDNVTGYIDLIKNESIPN